MPFWEDTPLLDMNHEQWESVCDRCGKCCLQPIEDEQTAQVVYTNVACDLLDAKTCHCSDYRRRSERVPTCVTMNKDNVYACMRFAPASCAYRLLLEGKPLPSYHHLITQNLETIHQQNQSVQNKTQPQSTVDENKLEDYVVDWV